MVTVKIDRINDRKFLEPENLVIFFEHLNLLMMTLFTGSKLMIFF
jgi:hypothetical protein